MDSIGLDVHKNETQVCVLTQEGELVEQRMRTTAERLAAVLGKRSKARILIEASTESEWVARVIEGFGHEVIVADPNYAPMYASRNRKTKTDRRDARMLAEACRVGTYRRAHRTSEEQRRVRAELTVRETLVRTRSRYISVMRSLIRREGLRIRDGSAEGFLNRLEEMELPQHLRLILAPLVVVMTGLNQEIKASAKHLADNVKSDELVRRLCTVPGIGPVTSVTFKAIVDQVSRFDRAHQLEAYLGLVPVEYSSGDKQRLGAITKAGNTRLRCLLVEAAWSVMMHTKNPETATLRAWADRIAQRRGRKVAGVALARKLAGILFAIWRDGTVYGRPAERPPTAAAQAA